MTRKIGSFYSEIKRRFRTRRRTFSPQEEITRLTRAVALLAATNTAQAQVHQDQAEYIRFLVDKCQAFELDAILRRVERGELVL